MKKPKDNNAPKRPLSAFFLYMKDERGNVVKRNPKAKNTEIVKILGAQYRNLNKNKLDKYHKEADKLKSAYSKKITAYKKTKKYEHFQHELAEWKHQQKAHWAFKKQHYYYTRDHHYLRE